MSIVPKKTNAMYNVGLTMIFCEGLKTSVVGKAAIQVRSTILDVLFIYTLQAKLMMLYSDYALASLALQRDRFHQILFRIFSTQSIKIGLFI